ncbi:MAG: proline--tRNA ligase [Thermodesulfobacteriota bacterium]|nr:proline--tRNA ligase [Thermodesulfobacteriota bacterium]
MRYSEMFLPTTKETPSDAEIVSHRLMLRAGMIRKLAGGIYAYLPLGYRVIRKVENIVREEMNRAGAQEVFMPAVQPAELWMESGRWDIYGKELLRVRDRHNRDYCIGPTHEEVITALVRDEIQTYRQLPRNLYQVQTKFRDEIRPRFGIMRSREFGMKDAYSFDADEESAEESYRKMFDAYTRIFTRCGLSFRPVEADSGNIGGSFSHEFMVTADSGEDAMVHCTSCDYAANLEKAEISRPEKEAEQHAMEYPPMEEVHTPDVRTIEEVCAFLDVEPRDVVKTMIFMCDGKPVAVLVRGNEDINEAKLRNYLGCDSLELAMDDTILEVTGSPRGFAGPIGIKSRIIVDYSLTGMKNFVTGANREDHHIKNCNIGRDFEISDYADLRIVREGDICPRCGKELRIIRGIEVGHVFKLGVKYSKAMNATFLDRDGKEKYMIMGCYGIGIGRTAAACIEQSNDDDGIIWPMSIAPFQVIITPVNIKDENLSNTAEELYNNLVADGVEVILDDRNERAGVKFKDADLTGIPIRITVGAKSLAERKVEVRFRRSGEVEKIPLETVRGFITKTISNSLECT